MKQSNRSMWVPKSTEVTVAKQKRSSRRTLMNRLARRLMIGLLVLIIIVSVLAGLLALNPLIFRWNAPVLRYTRTSAIDYFVDLQPDSFGGQTTLSADLVYLDHLVKGVQPTFIYTFDADREVDIQASWKTDATLRIRDAADPEAIVLNQTLPLVTVKKSQLTATKSWILNEPLKIDLASYRAAAAAFAENNPANLRYELVVVLDLDLAIIPAVASDVIHIREPLTLIIPLNQAQYRIERDLPAAMPEWATIHQDMHYQVQLTGIPFYFFPIAAGLAFIVLVIFLAFTRSLPKDRFRGRLRRMLRLARGRLMLIGDKAWEPEWCVAVTDYRAMVRTAKRLKHPIFCYIDRMKPWPVAYFYVYYGENNYCHIYTEHPEMLHADDLSRHSRAGDDEADDEGYDNENGVGSGGVGGSGNVSGNGSGGGNGNGNGSGGIGGNGVNQALGQGLGQGRNGRSSRSGADSRGSGKAPSPITEDAFRQMDDNDQDELDDTIPVLPEVDDPSSADRRPDITVTDLTDRK